MPGSPNAGGGIADGLAVMVEILDPRVDPEPEGWSSFMAREKLLAPWDYGLMRLESQASVNPTVLGVTRQGGRIVAAFAAMMCRRSRLSPSWLEIHHPWLSGIPGWVIAEGLDPPAVRQLVREFESAACRFAGPACLGLVYRNVPHEQVRLVTGRLRIVRDTAATAVLDNTFSTMEDWVASLARRRRSDLRRQFRRVAEDPDLTVRFEAARQDLDGSELATLLRTHRARFAKLRFDHRSAVSANYLSALVRRPDVHTLTYHDGGGRLLAFAVQLDHHAMPVFQHWASLAIEQGGRKHLYFDCYARMVRRMVEGSRMSITAGRGMLDVKASLGFTPRPLRVVVAPRPVAG
jgi:Acetyltransferase (GNAT) domain